METIQIHDIKRFDTKTEARLLKATDKILSNDVNPISEDEAVKLDTLGLMDVANVLLLEGKTEEAKRLLSRYADRDRSEVKIPSLDYSEDGSSKYSSEYLKAIIEFFAVFDHKDAPDLFACGSIRIGTKNDYPLTVENDHFKILLAPRVDND